VVRPILSGGEVRGKGDKERFPLGCLGKGGGGERGSSSLEGGPGHSGPGVKWFLPKGEKGGGRGNSSFLPLGEGGRGGMGRFLAKEDKGKEVPRPGIHLTGEEEAILRRRGGERRFLRWP